MSRLIKVQNFNYLPHIVSLTKSEIEEEAIKMDCDDKEVKLGTGMSISTSFWLRAAPTSWLKYKTI